MKKFFISVLILAVFGGVIFYLGWTQIKVKPGQFGVVISKTSGINEKPVINGKYSWHWQFLLPTNAKIESFTVEPANLNKEITGELPSGSVYSAVYNSSDNFSYKICYSISLTVSPEAVIRLLKENKISDNQNLYEYLEKAGDVIAQSATDFILAKVQEKFNFRPESIRREELIKSIRFYKDFPDVDISAFAITSSSLPDYALYKKIQEKVSRELELNSKSEEENL